MFIFYALGDGIFNILKKTKEGVRYLLEKPPPSQQLDSIGICILKVRPKGAKFIFSKPLSSKIPQFFVTKFGETQRRDN